jgi:hypothetical protein
MPAEAGMLFGGVLMMSPFAQMPELVDCVARRKPTDRPFDYFNRIKWASFRAYICRLKSTSSFD